MFDLVTPLISIHVLVVSVALSQRLYTNTRSVGVIDLNIPKSAYDNDIISINNATYKMKCQNS